MVYNRREIGWPIESDLRQDLAVGIHYSLDPCSTQRQAATRASQALLPGPAKGQVRSCGCEQTSGQTSSTVTAPTQSTGLKPADICRDRTCRFSPILHPTLFVPLTSQSSWKLRGKQPSRGTPMPAFTSSFLPIYCHPKLLLAKLDNKERSSLNSNFSFSLCES